MSSPQASAIWPHLAKAEAKVEQKAAQQSSGRPTWARSSHPAWDVEPARPAPGYSIVPGLKRIDRR
jgi:hypothetical protein